MYCVKCGSELNSNVCAVCGSAVAVATVGHDAVTGLALASWAQRAGATAIDSLVLIIPGIALYLLVYSKSSLAYTLLGMAMQGTYLVWFLSRPDGQTIGNRAAHTRVVNATTGQPLEVPKAFARWFVMAVLNVSLYLVVGIVLLPLDYLFPLWDKRRQTLHDKVAGTIVVRV